MLGCAGPFTVPYATPVIKHHVPITTLYLLYHKIPKAIKPHCNLAARAGKLFLCRTDMQSWHYLSPPLVLKG